MNKKYYRNNSNRLHLVESDDIIILDKKRVKKVRMNRNHKENDQYNNSNKH